jgi:putative SOS response-associated peptidase YedK
MCARFQIPAQAAAERYWRLVNPLWQYEASWRVLPTDPVPVVLMAGSERTGRMMRWDLVPFRNHGKPTGKVLINAKVENLETNYYWTGPWSRRQRCIFSMAGFYEPHKFDDGRKEPFYVHVTDREIFGVAGLWDRSKREDGTEVYSCTLITIPPNALMASVHNEKLRMPAVLREEDHDTWLGAPPSEAKAALRPYPDDLMVAWQVSRRVNSPKASNDKTLIEPVTDISSPTNTGTDQ